MKSRGEEEEEEEEDGRHSDATVTDVTWKIPAEFFWLCSLALLLVFPKVPLMEWGGVIQRDTVQERKAFDLCSGLS